MSCCEAEGVGRGDTFEDLHRASPGMFRVIATDTNSGKEWVDEEFLNIVAAETYAEAAATPMTYTDIYNDRGERVGEYHPE